VEIFGFGQGYYNIGRVICEVREMFFERKNEVYKICTNEMLY